MQIFDIGIGPIWEPLYGKQGTGTLLGKTKTLFEIVTELETTHIDFLKIDVEGNEFSAIPEFIKDPRFPSLKVSQILVELHFFGKLSS
jgi:hypothetical protein